mgnify:CR=1 FL=1
MAEVNGLSAAPTRANFATPEQNPVQRQEQQRELQTTLANEQNQRSEQINESAREETVINEQLDLQSEAARNEQRQRDQELRTEQLGPNQITPPNQDTIRQLEQNAASQQQQTQNANGLGQTAINSYNSLNAQQQSDLLRGQINVDITA